MAGTAKSLGKDESLETREPLRINWDWLFSHCQAIFIMIVALGFGICLFWLLS